MKSATVAMILSLFLILNSTSGQPPGCTCYDPISLHPSYPPGRPDGPGFFIAFNPNLNAFSGPALCPSPLPPPYDFIDHLIYCEVSDSGPYVPCCKFCCRDNKPTNKPNPTDGNPAITPPYNFAIHSVNINVFIIMGLIFVLLLKN